MYPVSNAYLTEILKNDRVTDIYGTITLTDGTVIELSKGDFAEAPETDQQCSGSENWTLGSVNQSQLKFAFYSNLDSYTIYDATVELFFALWLPEDEIWEEIPIGKYRVVECTRSGLNKIKVTSLDSMDALDTQYDGATVSGSPYDILYLISTKTGIDLGQTEEQIAALPNGTADLGLPGQTNIQTYRDMLRDLSVCLAGFGYIGRDGKLYIGQFSKTSCRTISANNRGNDTIAIYKVAYSAVSCNKNGTFIAVGTDERQLLDLEDNQFLQLGLDETIEGILDNILDAISEFEYVPGSLSLLKSDPSFDPGDVVTSTGYTSGVATVMPIHKMVWKWGGGQKIEAYGKDPRIGKTKTKDEKTLENKINTVATLENDALAMQNLRRIQFNSSWVQLAAGYVSIAEEKKILFHAAVRITMNETGSVKFKYQLNGIDEDFIHVCQMPEGLHTLTLFHYVTAVSTQVNRFRVFIESSGPTGVVERLGFNGVLTGPGINVPEFDGNLELEDEINPLAFNRSIVGLSDSVVGLPRETPESVSVSDTLEIFKFNKSIAGLIDYPVLTGQTVRYTRTLEDGETVRIDEDGGIRLTEGNLNA